MASRQEYEMMFTLQAKLGGGYSSSFKQAQASILAMQNELQAFNKTQADISAYQKQQSALKTTKSKLSTLQQQYDNIQREIEETGTYSSALENRLLSKQLQIEKTSTSVDNQTSKLNQMGEALRKAGINTDDLASESQKLGQQIDDLKDKQEEAAQEADDFGDAGTSAFMAIQQALVAAGITAALKEIYEYLSACAEASMEFESAMTGVAKTTDMSDAELIAMGEEIKALSTEIPIFTSDLAEVGEVAGQLGIAKDNLLDFSTVMSMLATATTMSADEAATMLAQFANITQMNPAFYSNLASTIVDLGNNFATTEQKITEMAQGIAASASLAGMSEADMMALSAAVTSLGIETQAGSTSMSKLISELMTAVETGENLTEFASIANMSAGEFASAWGNDAVGALQAFVLGLSDTERNGKSATVALTELGITETRMQRMVLSLANSGDLLNRTLDTADQAWSSNTALVSEAEKRYATTQSQLTLMQNAYNNLKIAIGDNFTPILREVYAIGTDVLNDVAAFISANPALVKAITVFIAVLGTVVIGLTAYTVAAKIAAAASTMLSAAIPGVNIILGITAAVAALTAAFVALASVTDEEAEELRNMSEASRQQYFELQELKAEYEETCETLGETSYEAQSLQWEIESLTDEFERNKQSLEEFVTQVQDNIKASQELVQSYHDAIAEIDTQEQSTTALIDKLAELASQNETTAATQVQMQAIIDSLNESLPELNLNYQDVISHGANFIESLKSMAQAEAAQRRYNQSYQDYVALLSESTNLSSDVEEAAGGLESAQARYAAASDAYSEKLNALTQYDTSGMAGLSMMWSEEQKELDAASAALETYQAQLNDATNALADNEAAQQECLDILGEYTAAEAEGIDNTALLNNEIRNVTDRMEELATAYDDAYEAALTSLQGQYELWEEAAKVAATDSETINAALESQASYWHEYNANLSSLSERSADIEGLSDMIASFADGSEGSVNAVAGMASATDEDLKAMVENWKTLQAEQSTTADHLAELETDFTASMDALQTELETTVAEMDLNEAAVVSGTNTIQGFINGAESMTSKVQEAYAKIAQAAVDAMNDQLKIHSPSDVTDWSGEMTVAGFNRAPERMKGETRAAYGVIADTAVEALAPDYNRPVRGLPHFEVADGDPYDGSEASGDPRVITIQLQPVYHIYGGGSGNEGITEKLRRHDAELIELIRDVLEEINDNEKRTKY